MTRFTATRFSSRVLRSWLFGVAVVISSAACQAADRVATVVEYYGYPDCIELRNDHTTVTLCPAAGGRVLQYALDGTNALYLPPGNEGWVYENDPSGGVMNAGRFDIGPEKMVKRGPLLWLGRWQGEITGDGSARLTSQFDPVSGVRLIRDFELADSSAELRCTQTIVNESDQPVSLCHWSRTFAVGGGIAIVPRSPRGRFPDGYVMYGNDNQIFFRPAEANIRVTDEAVYVQGAPTFPKLGFDSHAGWFAYLTPHDLLFIKRFPTYPERAYNEVAGLTISVWYPDRPMCELEPIGPAESIAPQHSASFTETWLLQPYPFPTNVDEIDVAKVKQAAGIQARSESE